MMLQERLSRLLEESGAARWGWSEAGEVEADEWLRFEKWLEAGHHAGMEYMACHRDLRRDPRLLLDGAKTVISVAFNYRQANPYKGVATYALGLDYHKVLRQRLKGVVKALKGEFGGEWRICIDSAPILERYWAVRSGVGVRSRGHGNVIVPGVGSMVFLAEILTTLEIGDLSANMQMGDDVETMQDVEAAQRVCPGGALLPGGMVDSRRCLNYLTIEKVGALEKEERELVERTGTIFGCDLCQRVCSYNMCSHNNKGEVPGKLCAENKGEVPGNICAHIDKGEMPGILPEFMPLEGLVIADGLDRLEVLKRAPAGSPLLRGLRGMKKM
ncbi:MAG: DUF1730 domain-containing protein [Muribaculaceae bacterium]|nr:DUF1730 domain-containing protein [Muribaculaceae bacterium]